MDFFRTGQLKKAVWRDRSGSGWAFYCPFCRTSRRVAHRSTPSLRHYFQVGLTAVVFSCLMWKWFAWKGLVSFVPLWMIFEMVYRARARAALSCPQCGFDPYLHLVDARRSKSELEEYWRKKFADQGILSPASEPVKAGDEAPEALQ